jgi:DNA polymerase elongation subunit (family B)
MWTTITTNYLKKKNIIAPVNDQNKINQGYIGGYVKDPQIGMHKWVVSFDLNSLYPHLIIQYNISPETFIDPQVWNEDQSNIRVSGVSIDNLLEMKTDTTGLKTHNITMTPNGHFFKRDKQGFLSELMENMYNDRVVYKRKYNEARKQLEGETDPDKKADLINDAARYNNLQLAKKVCLNSAYGAIGNQYFLFYDVRQAAAITTAGQLSIKWIEKHINEYMNKLLKTENIDYVIAADTDSVYLSFDEFVKKTILVTSPNSSPLEIVRFLDKVCENKFQTIIDNSFKKLAEYINAFAQKMMMKREVIADKGVWTAKKRYLLNVYNSEGVEYAQPKIKVTGLEMIKSSTPGVCRKKLLETIPILLNNTEKEMIDFISSFRKEFKLLAPEDIAFPRGVNGIDKYSGKSPNILFIKGTPIHVRGSLVFNRAINRLGLEKKYEEIKNGEKIKFVYLKEPNIFQSNVISFPSIMPKEFDISKFIDYNTQFDKAFLEPLKVILNTVGWKTEKSLGLFG